MDKLASTQSPALLRFIPIAPGTCLAMSESAEDLRILQENWPEPSPSEYQRLSGSQESEKISFVTEDLSELTDWVISNGGHSKVKVEDNAKVGRHLVFTEDVLDQTAIVSVPADLVFTLRNAPKKLTEILDSIPEDVLDRSEASDLLLYLLYERFRKDTRWKTFLATQPAGFSSPILDDRCDRFLQGTPLLPVCQSLRHEMSETFEKLQKYLLERWPAEFPKDQFDRETLKWAQAICESRSFKVLVEDVEETVLVPLVDMANHDPTGCLFRDLYDPERGFHLRISGKSFRKGDELNLRYGELPNWELLLHYGFALENNPHDRLDILLDSSDEDDNMQSAAKRALLLELGRVHGISLEHSVPRIDPKSSEGFPKELLASMRLISANESELEPITINNLAEKTSHVISDRCEREVFSTLEMILQATMASLGTSLQSDLKDREHHDGDVPERLELRKIIQSLLDWVMIHDPRSSDSEYQKTLLR